MHKPLRTLYLITITLVFFTTTYTLLRGYYHIASFAVAGFAFGSILVSLLPFFTSQYLLKRYESGGREKKLLLILAIVLYICCFPIKIWVLYSNLDVMFNGGLHWNFG